jgi:hypothetical protein
VGVAAGDEDGVPGPVGDAAEKRTAWLDRVAVITADEDSVA